MSSDDVTTEDFAQMTPAQREAAKEAVEESGGLLSGFSLPSFDGGLGKKSLDLALSTDEGLAVGDVKEAYDCGDGAAMIVRGVTRMAGLDDVPAIADIFFGYYKMQSEAMESRAEAGGE